MIKHEDRGKEHAGGLGDRLEGEVSRMGQGEGAEGEGGIREKVR